MKDNNTIYLFAVIMSLGIAGFVMYLLVATLGIPFYIIAIFSFVIISFLARKAMRIPPTAGRRERSHPHHFMRFSLLFQ